MRRNRKIAAVLAALFMLCAAFFWGGNYAAKTGGPAASPPIDAAATAWFPLSQETPSPVPPFPGGSEPSSSPSPSPESVLSPGAANPPRASEKPAEVPPSPETPLPSESEELFCVLSVSCETILDHTDSFNPDKLEILPSDGILFPAQTVQFYQGETVFNVLQREMKKNKIHMEFTSVPLYNSNYIEGIGNIYEFDCGELSGWVYRVNGQFPGTGASQYTLEDGDTVEWLYTCDRSKDLGGSNGVWEDPE